jgi:hypothetical protein
MELLMVTLKAASASTHPQRNAERSEPETSRSSQMVATNR